MSSGRSTPVRAYRWLSDLHERPRLAAWATTPLGVAALCLVAALLAPSEIRLLFTAVLAAYLLLPAHRGVILGLGSLALLVEEGLLAVPVLGAVAAVYLAARNFSRLPGWVRKNAVLLLHIVLWALLVSVWRAGEDTDRATVLAAMAAISFLTWRLSYLVLSGRRGSVSESGFLDHLLYCWPVFGGTNAPFGKGFDYLSRVAERDLEAIRGVQLAGIKLLFLSKLWLGLRLAIALVVHGETRLGIAPPALALDLPRLGQVIAGTEVSTLLGWGLVFLELVDRTLAIAVMGHAIVGCLRLFGFRAFRNTYKPLLSETIVDFWNRFYYYFKELLVEFFFFPTYVARFKRRPRLRIFAAVMAAAFIGNVYYHLLRDAALYLDSGWAGTWELISPRVFYSLLLALGIFASMVRQQARRGGAGEPRSSIAKLRAIAGVWLFFALIRIWTVEPIRLSFADRTAFCLSLFGLG